MVKIKIFQLNAVYLDLHKYYVAQKHQYNCIHFESANDISFHIIPPW